MVSVGKLEAMARAGFAARGVMYVVIGYLFLRSGRAEDGAGALEALDGPGGTVLLAAMALGFVGYGVWRLAEAIVDTEGRGSELKGIAVRAGGGASGLVHLGLSVVAASLAAGQRGGTGGEGAQQGAATALSLPGGRILLIVAAAALVATGLYQLAKALRDRFLRTLDRAAAGKAWIVWLGRAGHAARGLVFLIMGWLFWQAARDASSAEAGGIGKALASLPPALQLAAAAGLLLFGLFSLVEARYRRIENPHVLARLKGAGPL